MQRATVKILLILATVVGRCAAFSAATAGRHSIRASVRTPPQIQLVERKQLGGERQLDNINKAGPSEDRQAKIAELMGKLRAEGSVGDSSEMRAAESFMAAPKAPPSPPEEEEAAAAAEEEEETAVEGGVRAGWLDEAVDGAGAAAEATTGAPAAADDDDVDDDDGQPARTTSGIGGSWTPNEEALESTHAPKVSTWGVFERPADISKAYGGGRQIGVGGAEITPEDLAERRKRSDEALAKYRQGMGAERQVQDEHEEEIRAALQEARQLMRFGSTNGALGQLGGVREWLCASTELGSEVMLELGMALIAAGDNEGAKPVLSELTRRAPDRKVKRAAQQMLFQEEAQGFMKLDNGGNGNEEFAKMARGGLGRSLGVASDRRYDVAGAYLTSTKRAPVSTITEARTLLRTAAVRRDDGGARERLLQAVELLPRLPVADRMPEAKTAMRRSVGGEWLLGFTTNGKSISFAPPEACQQLSIQPQDKEEEEQETGAAAGEGEGSAGSSSSSSESSGGAGAFERLAPKALAGLVKSIGTVSLSAGDRRSASLLLDLQSCAVGPLPLPVIEPSVEERLVLLDPLMLITTKVGSDEFMVWHRPSMRVQEE
jgi:hypothetical protein